MNAGIDCPTCGLPITAVHKTEVAYEVRIHDDGAVERFRVEAWGGVALHAGGVRCDVVDTRPLFAAIAMRDRRSR